MRGALAAEVVGEAIDREVKAFKLEELLAQYRGFVDGG